MNACLCAFLLLTAGLVGPALVSTEPVALPQLARLVSGDPLPHAPLCHTVSAATVMSCANSSATCVTEITPEWVCKVKTSSAGCKCE